MKLPVFAMRGRALDQRAGQRQWLVSARRAISARERPEAERDASKRTAAKEDLASAGTTLVIDPERHVLQLAKQRHQCCGRRIDCIDASLQRSLDERPTVGQLRERR